VGGRRAEKVGGVGWWLLWREREGLVGKNRITTRGGVKRRRTNRAREERRICYDEGGDDLTYGDSETERNEERRSKKTRRGKEEKEERERTHGRPKVKSIVAVVLPFKSNQSSEYLPTAKAM